ncbi:solute carrier family 22 member 13-like [Paroedura picta]|uniref:solute carrier family 22 member 13-like n=1 Tax=Paroedura picta TaxID=143630 RepID=UPI0040567278
MAVNREAKAMEFGDILQVIGEFGWFQKRLVLLICIPNFLTAFQLFGQVFSAKAVPHHCNTSWVRKLGLNLTEEQEMNLTIPRKPDGSFHKCQMFSPVQGHLQPLQLNATESCRDGWVYPEKLQPTLVTEFDLVCERAHLTDISQSVFMGGVLAGALVLGPLSDRIGSRNMILLTLLMMGFFGTGAGMAPRFSFYMAMRFFVGSAFAGISISMAALISEWVGATHRPFVIIITHCCNSVGQMTLAGLAYGIQEWRLYQIVGSFPWLCLFFYIWVLPSSARWLLTRGKVEEAKSEIQRAAAINKRNVPEELLDQLSMQKRGASGTTLDVFTNRHLRKVTIIMAWLWFVVSLVYYGMSLQIEDFGLDIYMTQFVFGAIEIPARFCGILLLQRIGRKKCQAGWFLLGGIVCMIIPAVMQTSPLAVTVLAVINKAAFGAAFSTIYLFSVEVFPTVVRQTCLAVCSVVARIGGIIAPLANILDKIHPAISVVLFGVTALAGGLLCFFLPETQNRDLQDDTTESPSQVSIAENYKSATIFPHQEAPARDFRRKDDTAVSPSQKSVAEDHESSLGRENRSVSFVLQEPPAREFHHEDRDLQDDPTVSPSQQSIAENDKNSTNFPQESPSRDFHHKIQQDSQDVFENRPVEEKD